MNCTKIKITEIKINEKYNIHRTERKDIMNFDSPKLYE